MQVSFDFDSIFSEVEERIKQLKEENQSLKIRGGDAQEIGELRKENNELKGKLKRCEIKLASLLKELNEVVPSSSPAHSEDKKQAEQVKPASVYANESDSPSPAPPMTSSQDQPLQTEEGKEAVENKREDIEKTEKKEAQFFEEGDNDEQDPFGDEEDPFSSDDDLEEDDSDFFKNVISKDREQ